jgi:hypothetical protein
VAAAGIVGDREHRVAVHRVDDRAFADEDVAVDLHRIGGRVAVLVVGGVVAEEVDRLLALEIHQAQDLAP